MNLLIGIGLFALANICIWFSVNYQLIEGTPPGKAFGICLALSIPTSLCAFFATKTSFIALESAWSVRLMGFGVSYLVFPILTYIYLNETPFNIKTGACIMLSFIIIAIQVFARNN
jgi:heme/copper-type cytochrome/quinol oxidase subunit 4